MSDRRVLLVEGTDDQHVMWALLKAHQVPEVFKVIKPRDENATLSHIDEKNDSGGVSKLLDSIPVWLKSTGLERLGILLDADDELSLRWQQVRDRLGKAQITGIPNSPDPRGTIIQVENGPIVGIWLMPDNALPGILEHFLAFLIPADDRSLAYVDGFLSSIAVGDRLFPDGRHAKARIHAWLAIQREPGKPLGQSITARYLDADARVVEPFVTWIRKVFVD
jgi:hypothetical protein